MFTIIITVVVAAAAAWFGYQRGRVRGCTDTLDAIQKPAQALLDEWYPFGVPTGEPRSALDVMAQMLEPITKL